MTWTPGPMHGLRDAGLQLLHRAADAVVLGHVHRKWHRIQIWQMHAKLGPLPITHPAACNMHHSQES